MRSPSRLPSLAETMQIDRLLDVLPGSQYAWTIRGQSSTWWLLIDLEETVASQLTRAGTWASEPLVGHFALWRNTGAIYRLGEEGVVLDPAVLEGWDRDPLALDTLGPLTFPG